MTEVCFSVPSTLRASLGPGLFGRSRRDHIHKHALKAYIETRARKQSPQIFFFLKQTVLFQSVKKYILTVQIVL